MPETLLTPEQFVSARSNDANNLVDSSNPAPRAFVTTTNQSANFITPTGTPFDGVVDIIVNFPSGASARGSGTLLPTGDDILTAAHIFFDANGVFATSANVFFDLPAGVQGFTTNVPQLEGSYNGSVVSPGDIAVLPMNGIAPADAQRFDIYRDNDEIGQQIEKTGYGRSGTGLQGSVLASGTKRDGENLFDAAGEALNGTVYVPGTITPGSHLAFDFDNGNAVNDASGQFLGIADLGVGANEVSTAPGDSGGPAFIGDLIAGVTSFGQGFNGGTDVLAGTNSSFGEFALDTRVSTYAPFIDAIIDEAGAPQITNVTISGSTSTHDPFAFNDPNDEAGDFDGSGIQLRTVPVGGANQVSIQFSEHVIAVAANSLSLKGLTTGMTPQLATGGFTYDVGTHVATWTYDQPFDADQYVLSLSDNVTDVVGDALDGEWTNPFSVSTTNAAVSEFPSGNGTAGGDFNFAFTILPGDGNLDNRVDGSDFLFVYQPNIGGPGNQFTQADWNGDGFTDGGDETLYQQNFGADLADLVFADFDQNGIVDGTDFNILSANYGSTNASHADGDADHDGTVGGSDYLLLQHQFGLELDWVA